MEIKTIIDSLGSNWKIKYKDVYNSKLKFVEIITLNGKTSSFWTMNGKFLTRPLSEMVFKRFVYDVSLKYHPDKNPGNKFVELIGQLFHKPDVEVLIDVLLLPFATKLKNEKKYENSFKFCEILKMAYNIINKHTFGIDFMEFDSIKHLISMKISQNIKNIEIDNYKDFISFLRSINSDNSSAELKDMIFMLKTLYKLFHGSVNNELLWQLIKDIKTKSKEDVQPFIQTEKIRIKKVGPKSAKLEQKRLQRRITRSMSKPRCSKRLTNKINKNI
jgi:hypothetical protein